MGLKCCLDCIGILCVGQVKVDFGVGFGGQYGFEVFVGIVVGDVVDFEGWLVLDYFQFGVVLFVDGMFQFDM